MNKSEHHIKITLKSDTIAIIQTPFNPYQAPVKN